jgi:ring-1,2-phenylacetyl-CoA epoxidase subunit PaaA
MRQQFLNTYVPRIWELDLSLPDPELKKNPETAKWEFTEPDWDEFFKVINGDGPCNKERLAVRRWAEEHGLWVRNALKNPDDKYVVPYA